jgi:hypothetical protein
VDDHGVELVAVRAGVEAVPLELESGGHFDLGVVLGEIVVESLESEHQHQGQVLEVELAHSLLRLAALAREVVVLPQVLRKEEGVDDAATLLELRVHQSFLIDLSFGHFPLGQRYLLVEGLRQ